MVSINSYTFYKITACKKFVLIQEIYSKITLKIINEGQTTKHKLLNLYRPTLKTIALVTTEVQ